MSKTELYLSNIVKYGLYVILITPLVFWPRALYGFMTPKFILFQVLVEIVFGAWLILRLLKFDFGKLLKSDFNNWLVITLVLLMAISFISAFLGVDFSRSFWGIGARMTGLFTELHFLAWFLVLASTFRSGSTLIKADQRGNNYLRGESATNPHISAISASTYLNFSFAVSVFVAITGFFTVLEWRLVPGYTVFNNPTFVVPYLLFHFFWGIYQTINLKSKISNLKNLKKWLFATGSALIFFMIFLGQIRGAIVGFLAAILFFGIFLIFSNIFSKCSKILVATFFVVIIGVFLGIWHFRELDFVQNISTFKRLTQISLSDTTVQTRLFAWQSALGGLRDKPFFGVGPENFNYLFNAYYNPKFLRYGIGETWFDKPHNAFLETLTETGLIGGLSYSFVLGSIMWALFRLFIKEDNKFLSLSLTAAFIAYLVSIFFSFDSFGSWFGSYLFLAFLASQNRDTNIQMHTNYTNKITLSVLVSLVLISILASVFVNYSTWRANVVDADALRTFSRDQVRSIAYFKKSLNYFTPYQSEYQFDFIASVAGAIEKGIVLPNLEDTINLAINESDRALSAHPKNAATYTDMLRIYNILGTKGRDPQILVQAEEFGKKSLELSPNRQETMFYLARTALLKNDTKSAVSLTLRTVELDPMVKLSHWYLGLAYIADNQGDRGALEIKKALELGYTLQNDTEKAFIKNIGL